ncbi:MAG: hypothetical protein NC923_01900 [Candidatus Omnitrophica bacterium]|nr:hypothetical protein [Candidatus Omnitrophota bacterium]
MLRKTFTILGKVWGLFLLPAVALALEGDAYQDMRTKSMVSALAQVQPGYEFQSKNLPAASSIEEQEFTQESDSYFKYTPVADAKEMSGKIGIMKAASEYKYTYKLFGKLPIKFSVGQKYIGIDNSTEVMLPAHLVAVTTDIETTFPFFTANNTYLRIGVSPSFYGDDWSLPSSGFRIPIRTYLIYMPNEQWTYIFGVAVYSDFEKEVLPVLGFIYKPNDKLTFNIVPIRPNINYAINKKLSIFGEFGGAIDNEFEVSKGNLKNTILRYKGNYVGTGLQYDCNRYIRTSISTGLAFNRLLKYEDEIGKVKIDNTVYLEFRAQIRI